ncbi:MAG TPA: N-acyl homoserine lactonase family protein [Actinomycetes bacterium]|nr:N-acyl homoserine lactonase family protein [Actinomycetes bacterium]
MTPQLPDRGTVRRLDLGYFIRPATETGGSQPRVEPVLGYLVRHERGLLLFDTGIGAVDAETEAHYRPARRDLRVALTSAGVSPDSIDVVVNCHLHFDHCGGNALFAGRPIVVQQTELAAARGPDYTVPHLVDFAGARYQEVRGELELWPRLWIIPTPGHSDGHQSLVIRERDGSVVLAGQAHDFAFEFGAGQLARRAAAEGASPPLPESPAWLERIAAFDPRRVLFAHDAAVWEPAELFG